jgi:hypothetical protein
LPRFSVRASFTRKSRARRRLKHRRKRGFRSSTTKATASWDTAAGLFKNAVTQEKWQAAVQAARAPFGQMKSRTLKSATSTTTVPGAPDGEYVIFQFDASFEQKAASVETVTAIREKDGTWHVGGYFIK